MRFILIDNGVPKGRSRIVLKLYAISSKRARDMRRSMFRICPGLRSRKAREKHRNAIGLCYSSGKILDYDKSTIYRIAIGVSGMTKRDRIAIATHEIIHAVAKVVDIRTDEESFCRLADTAMAGFIDCFCKDIR